MARPFLCPGTTSAYLLRWTVFLFRPPRGCHVVSTFSFSLSLFSLPPSLSLSEEDESGLREPRTVRIVATGASDLQLADKTLLMRVAGIEEVGGI